MLFTFLVILALTLLYRFPVRRWFSRWGTTDEDLTRVMAGDSVISNPTHSATHALTVDAPPEDIWPWLVQMGYRRGGLYSYDWLDRLFGYLDRPSANRVLPEFQQLSAGDVIPLGRGRGIPVTAIEPSRTLVLSGTNDGFQWVWQFGLYPLDEGRTRLSVARHSAFRQYHQHVVIHARHGTSCVHHDAADAAGRKTPSGSAESGARRP